MSTKKTLGGFDLCWEKLHSLIHIFWCSKNGCLCVYQVFTSASWSSAPYRSQKIFQEFHPLQPPGWGEGRHGFSTYLWVEAHHQGMASPWPPQLVHETSSHGLGPAPHPPGFHGEERTSGPQSSSISLESPDRSQSFNWLFQISLKNCLQVQYWDDLNLEWQNTKRMCRHTQPLVVNPVRRGYFLFPAQGQPHRIAAPSPQEHHFDTMDVEVNLEICLRLKSML